MTTDAEVLTCLNRKEKDTWMMIPSVKEKLPVNAWLCMCIAGHVDVCLHTHKDTGTER